MDYQKGEFLYEGKAKRIFRVTNQSELVWLEYKDSLTAFNALKKGSFEGKGSLNCRMTTLIFKYLEKHGVQTHLQASLSDSEMVCRKLTIIPAEVVVRNILAGSTAKKFGIEEGRPLAQPLVEFYYKNDELADPFMSDDQALMMKVVSRQEELDELKSSALKIDQLLTEFFAALDIQLVDFKLEFGRTSDGRLQLGDEITPDSCRLWDMKTGEKMDKDRFRRDLGNVEEYYQEVHRRMQNRWEKEI
ncbi:MAG: phosphoribosylaminoimidazolesuccinocarboxamide synthase [Bdellovibrionales bacterium]|nr:phosphoribosylaminoimidazolesuccinocarboxamide synthase [Bdellovibrionales bacterium]